MRKQIMLTRAEPGILLYYSLNELTHPERGVGFDEWGICEFDDLFWVGKRVSSDGKDVLRLSLLEVLDKRNELYCEWGDEEIYVFVGFDAETHEFKWFLLSQAEYKLKDEMLERISIS